jgi:hypothetical protein
VPIPTIEITRVSPADQARSFDVGVYRAAYERGCNVSQLLERQDPTESYPEAERGLDAFERVLKAAGVRTQSVPEYGIRASTWQEATETAERRAMLHEWAARVWRRAVSRQTQAQARAVLLSGDAAINSLANPYVDDDTIRAKRLAPPIPLAAIVARTTAIDNDGYRTLYIVDDLNTDAYRMKRIAEGTEIPRTTLVTGEHTLRIGKFGRALQATYEQLRRQRLDRIAFIIERMAIQAEADKVVDAMNVIISGDGNANTAATVLNQTALDPGSSAGTLTLKAWLTAKMRFTVAYQADTVLAQEAPTLQLLLLPFNTVNGTPLMAGPSPSVGAIRPINDQFNGAVRYGVTADAPALKLVMFDSQQAVEQVTEVGGNVSEVERFITNQTQVLTLTEVVGFGTIDPNAARVVNVNA